MWRTFVQLPDNRTINGYFRTSEAGSMPRAERLALATYDALVDDQPPPEAPKPPTVPGLTLVRGQGSQRHTYTLVMRVLSASDGSTSSRTGVLSDDRPLARRFPEMLRMRFQGLGIPATDDDILLRLHLMARHAQRQGVPKSLIGALPSPFSQAHTVPSPAERSLRLQTLQSVYDQAASCVGNPSDPVHPGHRESAYVRPTVSDDNRSGFTVELLRDDTMMYETIYQRPDESIEKLAMRVEHYVQLLLKAHGHRQDVEQRHPTGTEGVLLENTDQGVCVLAVCAQTQWEHYWSLNEYTPETAFRCAWNWRKMTAGEPIGSPEVFRAQLGLFIQSLKTMPDSP